MRAFSILLTILLLVICPQRPMAKAAPNSDEAARVADALADLLVRPAPEYPYVARKDYLQGQGLYLVQFDRGTGLAREVAVVHSSGHPILDQAALGALRQWRIKPHTFEKIKIPFNFEIDGERAAFLRAAGRNLLYAVQPHYPFEANEHGVAGQGRFQLIINPSTGLVNDVQILETTRDRRLDEAAVKALRQWRFRPHTLTKLKVPVSFGYG